MDDAVDCRWRESFLPFALTEEFFGRENHAHAVARGHADRCGPEHTQIAGGNAAFGNAREDTRLLFERVGRRIYSAPDVWTPLGDHHDRSADVAQAHDLGVHDGAVGHHYTDLFSVQSQAIRRRAWRAFLEAAIRVLTQEGIHPGCSRRNVTSASIGCDRRPFRGRDTQNPGGRRDEGADAHCAEPFRAARSSSVHVLRLDLLKSESADEPCMAPTIKQANGVMVSIGNACKSTSMAVRLAPTAAILARTSPVKRASGESISRRPHWTTAYRIWPSSAPAQ